MSVAGDRRVQPYFVIDQLESVYSHAIGGGSFVNGTLDSVAYAFDLSKFAFPATVKVDFGSGASMDVGYAFFEVGGGYASNFDYEFTLRETVAVGPKYGLDVAGARSVSFDSTISGRLAVVGEAAFHSPGLSNLVVNNSGIVLASTASTALSTTAAFEVGGGVITNHGLIEARALKAYAIHAHLVDRSTPLTVENTYQLWANDGVSPNGQSYGIVVDGSANIGNSGEIVAGASVFYDGRADDATVAIAVNNAGMITGKMALSPGGDSVVNSGSINGSVELGAGADLYEGRLGRALGAVLGGSGADTLNGGVGAETLDGGAGNDCVFGGQGDDLITDASGSNYLRGDEGNDSISGGGAFDDINGNMGDDTAHGNDGGDWVVGGKDQDLLYGDGGDDIVYGNMGDDTCYGGTGADTIRGGQDNDTMSGAEGNDWLSGDRGADTISGGSGADTFYLFKGSATDRVIDFNRAEGDRVQLDPGQHYALRQDGADAVIDLGDGDQLILVGVQAPTLTGAWLIGG